MKLGSTFRNLDEGLSAELEDQDKDRVLNSLTRMPYPQRIEYQKYLEMKLPDFQDLKTVSEIFQQLRLYYNFLDYTLLMRLINDLGSESLKSKMSAYDREIQEFMNVVTMAELQQVWPGRKECPPDFDEFLMRIDKDPRKCSLKMVNDIRKKICIETRLSERVLILNGIIDANSFILVFMVPSVVGLRLIESVGSLDSSFYQRECIIHISLNEQQLYLSEALREKKVCP